VDQAEFDAERWCRILQDQKVSVWYTAPTAIRMLMKVGADVPRRFYARHLEEAAIPQPAKIIGAAKAALGRA
jgi:acyl-coenzyme A synthetase/AMP-(fatty) acid ligase